MEIKPTMAEMSGESSSAPRLVLNEIQFNGKKNLFYYVNKKKGLVETPKGKRYEQESLGESVSVVFLRIRRRLRQYRKDEKPLVTNEHNTKSDMLTLFGDTQIIKGSNDALKERYPNLRTNQTVYCLFSREGFDDEIVRLNVKGSSLGSKSKAKDVHTFYSYVSSFKDGGADDHFYDFITELYGVEESSDLGEYYSMSFRKGLELTQDLKEKVVEMMIPIYTFIKQSDLFYETKKIADLQKASDKVVEDEEVVIEYPEDEINPEDIPF